MQIKRNTVLTKWTTWFTVIAMTVCLLPVNLWETEAATTLNNPVIVDNGDGTSYTTWDCVYFGNYPQSSEGNGEFKAEPIKWRVLSVDGDDAFLLADKNLDCKPYHSELTEVTWENCTIRSFLNGYAGNANAAGVDYSSSNFIDTAFSAEEQNAIRTTTVINKDDLGCGAESGSNTEDKLFLLSVGEAIHASYGFNEIYDGFDEARMAKNTGIVAYYSGMSEEGVEDNWWLRSPGDIAYDTRNIAYIDVNGGVDSAVAASTVIAVRPALHLNLSSDVWDYAGTISSDGTVDEEGASTAPDLGEEFEYTEGIEGGAIYYSIDKNTETIVITDCDEDVTSAIIPNEIDGRKVMKIGEAAFYDCQYLEDIIIPDQIESMGESAFAFCYSLSEINIPKGVTILEQSLFSDCGSLSKVTIPTSVIEITREAFVNCVSLKSIQLPDSLMSIGEYAFKGTNLSQVDIPKRVTTIEEGAFAVCGNLKKIIIPRNVIDIDDIAFLYSDNVTIYGYSDSYAETYAIDNEIPFIALTDSADEAYIAGDTSGSASSELKIGNSVAFQVPKDVPIIGGDDISMDFDNIPIQFEQEGNTYRLGIGVSDLKGFKEEGWFTFKKFIDSQKEDYRKGINSLLASKFGVASMGMSKKLNVSCYGYAEGVITADGIQSCGGKLFIEMKAKAKKEWQTMIAVVPVVLKANGEVGVENTYSVGLDFANASIYLSGESELTLPKVKASAGVGVAYIADISVYGSGKNKIVIRNSIAAAGGHSGVKASLEGEIGASAKLLFVEYEHAFLEGEWVYHDESVGSSNYSLRQLNSAVAETDESDWEINRTEASEWNGSTLTSVYARSAAAGEVKTLQTGIYNNGKPQLVQTENGKKLILYTADIEDREEGSHTAVVYSVYDENNDTWSEPAIIDDDGTADFDPSVAVKGEEVYVVWCNASRSFTKTDTQAEDFLSTLAASCEIESAVIDTAHNNAITTERLTDNTVADVRPVVYSDGTLVKAVWVQNTDNDLLEMSGTNSIYMADIDAGTDSVTKRISESKPIGAAVIGTIGEEKSVIAYTIDRDGDAATTQDKTLCTLDENGEKSTIKRSALCENPAFCMMGSENILMWYTEEEGATSLNYITEPGGTEKKLCDGELAVTRDYEMISSEDGKSLLVCAADKEEDTEGSNIAAWVIDGTEASEQVAMTDMEGYAVSPSGIYDDSDYVITFLRKGITIEASALTENTDLCITTVTPSSRLEMGEIEYLEEDMAPGESAVMDISVTNNGIEPCEGYTVQVTDPSGVLIGETTIDTVLEPGETKNVSVEVELPSDMEKASGYNITVIPQNEKDTGSSTQITVGVVDTQLTVEETGDGYTVKAKNVSGFEAAATLNIKDTDVNGGELASYDLGTIEPHGTVEETFTKEELAAFGYDCICMTLSTEENELFTNNNSVYLYVGDDVMATLDRIKAAKEKTEYAVGDKLAVDDLTVVAMYTDGSEAEVTDYTTNAAEIDMTSAGQKDLVITYEENFMVRKVTIPITVKAKGNVTPSTKPGTTTTIVGASNSSSDNASKDITVAKPKKVKSFKVSSKTKKKMTVKWKRDKAVTGYQITYALDKKFKKGKKNVTVKKNKTVKKTIGKLKSGKTYYVKIRAYKQVGKRKFYGPYSKARKVKIK